MSNQSYFVELKIIFHFNYIHENELVIEENCEVRHYYNRIREFILDEDFKKFGNLVNSIIDGSSFNEEECYKMKQDLEYMKNQTLPTEELEIKKYIQDINKTFNTILQYFKQDGVFVGELKEVVPCVPIKRKRMF